MLQLGESETELLKSGPVKGFFAVGGSVCESPTSAALGGPLVDTALPWQTHTHTRACTHTHTSYPNCSKRCSNTLLVHGHTHSILTHSHGLTWLPIISTGSNWQVNVKIKTRSQDNYSMRNQLLRITHSFREQNKTHVERSARREGLPSNTNSRLHKHCFGCKKKKKPPEQQKHTAASYCASRLCRNPNAAWEEQSRAECESKGKREWESGRASERAAERDETGEKHNLPAVVADAAARLCLLRCSCHQRLISHLYCQPLIGCCLGCSFHFDSLNCCLLSLWPTPASSWFKT